MFFGWLYTLTDQPTRKMKYNKKEILSESNWRSFCFCANVNYGTRTVWHKRKIAGIPEIILDYYPSTQSCLLFFIMIAIWIVMPLYHFIHLFIHSQRLFGIGLNTLLLLLYIYSVVWFVYLWYCPLPTFKNLTRRKVEETKTINVSCSISYWIVSL